MSSQKSLQSLETLLEKFLDQVVNLKEQKLSVLEGINRLDDITSMSGQGVEITDHIGEWFADHNRWLTDNSLRKSEFNRISEMLTNIKSELEKEGLASPAQKKISTEIDRWQNNPIKIDKSKPTRMTLSRPPEVSETDATPQADTISLFIKKLSKMSAMFVDSADSKQHILTVLEDLLKKTAAETNKDALILSAFIIYYLKQNGYKVDPYVRKLKEAETLFKKGALHA